MKGQGRRKIIEEGKKRRERAGRKEKMRRLENEERRYSYKERKSVEGLLGERRQAEGDREDEMNEGEVQRERRARMTTSKEKVREEQDEKGRMRGFLLHASCFVLFLKVVFPLVRKKKY